MSKHLVSGPSVYDGLDEDAQVGPRVSGLVALQADPQARRAAVVQGHLQHQLLLAVLRELGGGPHWLLLLVRVERETCYPI